MKPALLSRLHGCKALTACLLLLAAPLATGYEDDTEGWTPRTFVAPDPWQEQDGELPAYPQQDRLLEVASSTGGQPYRVYVDPDSLVMGDDRVARYTVVIVSSSGVWNVSNEGLHCGERAYRRYAYGFDGQWQRLDDSAWYPVTGRGTNRYRKAFYDIYMCSPSEGYLNAAQVLQKLRSGNIEMYE